jgi:uncharacterized protein YcbK (DUF882 family)
VTLVTTRTRSEQDKIASLTAHTRAHLLLLLDAHPNLVVTSGRRSPQHNREVGGAQHSWHLKGRAVDLTGPLYDLQVAAQTAWRQRIGRECTGPEEVLLEHSGEPRQHLHVAW